MKLKLRIFSMSVTFCVLISALSLGYSSSAESLIGANVNPASETSVNIPEGTYFLRNKQTTYYADIQGPTMASGTEIHQWSFNRNNSQRWIFESVGSGYYTIKSANSSGSYYLGVKNDSNTQNADIVLRTGTITNGMKWKITTTTSGAYRLTPKTGDWALATSTSDQTKGNKLIQGAYVVNTSYRDEWFICDVATHAHISFDARILYDATCTYSASQLMQLYESAVEGFMANFNIEFDLHSAEYSSTLDLRNCHSTSLGDICTTACSALAACGSAHHKGAGRLLNLQNLNAYHNCRIVGYKLCYYDADESPAHFAVSGLGNVSGNDTALTTYELAEWQIKVVIQHELAHNLGASHADCDEGNCFLSNYNHTNEWCASCTAKIRSNF